MVDISKLKIGDKVCYKNKENGLVKEIPENSLDQVRVVYHCAGDWKNFKNYTSALTNVKDLTIGWIH